MHIECSQTYSLSSSSIFRLFGPNFFSQVACTLRKWRWLSNCSKLVSGKAMKLLCCLKWQGTIQTLCQFMSAPWRPATHKPFWCFCLISQLLRSAITDSQMQLDAMASPQNDAASLQLSSVPHDHGGISLKPYSPLSNLTSCTFQSNWPWIIRLLLSRRPLPDWKSESVEYPRGVKTKPTHSAPLVAARGTMGSCHNIILSCHGSSLMRFPFEFNLLPFEVKWFWTSACMMVKQDMWCLSAHLGEGGERRETL